MTLNAEKLSHLLERGRADECEALFIGAPEKQRQGVAKLAETWLTKVTRRDYQESPSGMELIRHQEIAGRVAVFAACSISTIKSFGARIYPVDAQIVRVLADRQPSWTNELAEHLLEGQIPAWNSVRSMMKAGLCSRPKHDNYVLAMTHHWAGVGGTASDPTPLRGRTNSGWSILTHLESEPDLLDEIWHFFELEGQGEYSLATHDKFASLNRWDEALVELSTRGVLSRERLLDESLAALDRGFAQFRAGWFSSLHERLNPSIEERITRQDRYLRLLANEIPPTVSFALTAVAEIDKEHPLDGTVFTEALRPVLKVSQKGTVKTALKLLEKIAKREPNVAPAVARVAADALIHAASDVQESALKLISLTGSTTDAELLDAVTKAQETVAASNRKRLQDWLDSKPDAKPTSKSITKKAEPAPKATREKKDAVADASPQSDVISAGSASVDAATILARAAKVPEPWRSISGLSRAIDALRLGQLDLSPCTFDGTEFPRLNPTKALCPIESLEELIDLAAALVESSDNYDDIERLFDGVSRLCDQRPSDFEKRTAPLLKRVRQLMKRDFLFPFVGHGPGSDAFGVILAWALGDYGSYGPVVTRYGSLQRDYTLDGETRSCSGESDESIRTTLSVRARQLADRVIRRQAVATLCSPTHAGGWIDPCVLVDRANNASICQAATELEQALALLRLAPEHRTEALSRLETSTSELHEALQFALSNDPMPDQTSKGSSRIKSDWLWIAAARARQPRNDAPFIEGLFPSRGPDGGIAATTTFSACVETRTHAFGSFQAAELTIAVSPEVPPEPIDSRLLSVIRWKDISSSKRIEFESAALIRQSFTLFPLSQEAACAWGAKAIGANLDWLEARWPNRNYLEPLLDPDLPLHPMAMLLLALGLAAKEPGESGLATDVAIAAIEDGRLDPLQLGSVMGQLLPTGYIKAARWAKTLGEVRRVSILHEEAVRLTLARSLRGEPASMPKDLHSIVELLKELVIETKTNVDEETSSFLKQIVGSSKLGKAAKTILASTVAPDLDRSQALQVQISEQRLARVERWMQASRGTSNERA